MIFGRLIKLKFENLQTGNTDVLIKPYVNADDVYIESESITDRIEALEKRIEMMERRQRKLAWQRRDL